MTWLLLGIVGVLVLAAVVLAVVAIPARRQGRVVFSTEGEQIIAAARERTVGVVDSARSRVRS
ncbi:MAG: hypothetical protein ACRCTR_00715 [Actinomycetota bacterium]